ncbi:MAG: hypothetical protein R3F49_16850 [Planctomycetota bacterium]
MERPSPCSLIARCSVQARSGKSPSARAGRSSSTAGCAWYALWHVATFLPFGWALARARHRPVGLRAQATYVVGWALLASLTLEGGKLLFAGRHPTLAHAAFDAIGAALGASIFHHQTQRRAETRT